MSKPLRIGLGWDMDYMIFSAMSGAEVETDWGDDVWTLECDHGKARNSLYSAMRAITEDIRQDIMKISSKMRKDGAFEFVDLAIISGGGNFRMDVLDTYKGNRVGKRKPVGYRDFCDKILEQHKDNSFFWPGVEGDDVLGILSTNPQLAGCDKVIIVSCDKDFYTIPGMFKRLSDGSFKVSSEAEADAYHMYQTLIGDTTDGYGGIVGVGPEAAKPFLADPVMFYQDTKIMKSGPRKGQEVPFWTSRPPTDEETLWDCMVSLAAKNNMTEAELLQQARVARILRNSDFDHETKQPILWTPGS
ncbi:DNA polymerase I [Pseudomonas phage UFJF_PfSW6]|uniref:DNA polymerase I n=1 Tax=Pseudomonas phage UFJF_PfSW6 TaxID=3003725 RepID=A0AAE9VM23_9CAUD|nr:DNA polymerase I [Pseudomonas phage UFJF_PfSW6]